MGSVEDILNEDYEHSIYIVDFHSLHKKSDIAIDKLTTYFQNIVKNERTTVYMFHDKFKGNLFAFFQEIYIKNELITNKDFEKMIRNVLNSKVRLHVKNYDLKVSDPYEHLSFYHWLCYCIDKNKGVNFTPYVYRPDQKYNEPDIADIICNMNYITKFRDNKYSVKYDDIVKNTKHTNALCTLRSLLNNNKRQKNNNMMKRFFENCKKDIFFNNFNKHFRITKDKTDYLSKKIVCDLLDLDYKSKKDIRNINDMLIGYGVDYKDQKMVNKIRGVFLCISLK